MRVVDDSSMISRRKSAGLLDLRRLVSGLLLLLLTGDLALHLAESYLDPAPPAASGQLQWSGAEPLPHADESNCPIPGHAAGLFHHHHFPGVITAHGEFAASQLQRLESPAAFDLGGSAARVARVGRAPPLA